MLSSPVRRAFAAARPLVFMVVFCGGCVLQLRPGNYVQTGPMLPSRAEDAPVRVFLTGWPSTPYEEIGVFEVKGGQLADRVARAQSEARRRGGDAIVLHESGQSVETDTRREKVVTRDGEGKVVNEAEVPVTTTTTVEQQRFVIVRMLADG